MTKQISYFTLLVLFMAACLGKPEFSNTPAITFKSISLSAPANNNGGVSYGDDIVVTVEFQDGDGDLGTNDTSIKSFNLGALRKQQGVFVPITFPSGFTFGGNFPPLSNVPNSPIKGEISNTVPFAYELFTSFPRIRRGDTVKFTIQLTDRAGNKSNIVQTPEVILGNYQ
jgi:hypothetical protein